MPIWHYLTADLSPARDIAFWGHRRWAGPVRRCRAGPSSCGSHGSMHMIRSELVSKLAEENPELSAREVDMIVTLFFDEIVDQLMSGGRVELRGFGAFSTRGRDARVGRNPRTGQSVNIPSKKVPYFKPGKEMRQRLNVS